MKNITQIHSNSERTKKRHKSKILIDDRRLGSKQKRQKKYVVVRCVCHFF